MAPRAGNFAHALGRAPASLQLGLGDTSGVHEKKSDANLAGQEKVCGRLQRDRDPLVNDLPIDPTTSSHSATNNYYLASIFVAVGLRRRADNRL